MKRKANGSRSLADAPEGEAGCRTRRSLPYIAKMAAGMFASRVFGRHRPLMVNIETTHRCNLDCTYCDKSRANSPQMELGAGLRVIDELASLGTISVCFDGGEPLFHPDIEHFVRRAKSHAMRVSMSTNGHLIKHKPKVLPFVDMVKISVDGPAPVHDAGRGKGSFEQAVEGAQLALQAGCKVALRMTLAEHNVANYRDVLALAKQLKVQALFQPAIGSIMNAADAPSTHSANATAYRAAIDDLKRLKALGEPVANEKLCLDHLRSWPTPKPVPFCSGGRVEVAIGPDGCLFPCGRVGRDRQAPNVFALGVAEAFKIMQRPADCCNCWCTLTLSACYQYRGDLRLLCG